MSSHLVSIQSQSSCLTCVCLGTESVSLKSLSRSFKGLKGSAASWSNVSGSRGGSDWSAGKVAGKSNMSNLMQHVDQIQLMFDPEHSWDQPDSAGHWVHILKLTWSLCCWCFRTEDDRRWKISTLTIIRSVIESWNLLCCCCWSRKFWFEVFLWTELQRRLCLRIWRTSGLTSVVR